MRDYEAVIVGAGAAGIGVGVALQQVGIEFVILEAHRVGASFLRWPRETRFITPSFAANAFYLPDLNAITPHSSPAFTLDTEHPSGREYARYLRGVVRHHSLPVEERTRVVRVERLSGGGFTVHTTRDVLRARFVIWATGEFQFPKYTVPGSELGIHYGQVSSWQALKGEQFVVIGGYESGADSAYQLTRLGKSVIVLDPETPWERATGEPSADLSPYTHDRLRSVYDPECVQLLPYRALSVSKRGRCYLVEHEGGTIATSTRPIVATGFSGGWEPVQDLYEFVDGIPLLTEQDESTLAEGLFLVGPKVRHRGMMFCFIYKFRGRFPVVAQTIAERLGKDSTALEAYRAYGMWVDDLDACCTHTCSC
ncbi:MAG: NAD(P)/FAD-dependent oxidoreductase [Fimbriimonadales bacterium]